MAILKEPDIFATPGPDPSHPVGYPVGQISVSVDATLECSWTSQTGCIANGVGKEVSSWGAQESSRAIMGAMPFQLFILITQPGHRASSLAGRLSRWDSGSSGLPACLQSSAPTVMEVPLEGEHVLVVHDAAQWLELLQCLS